MGLEPCCCTAKAKTQVLGTRQFSNNPFEYEISCKNIELENTSCKVLPIMFHVFAMCCQEIPCFFGYLEAIDGNVTRLFHEAEHGINKPSPQSPEIDGKKKHIPTLLAYDCFAHITPKPNV